MKKTKIIYQVLRDWFLSIKCCKYATFLNSEETIMKACNENKSIIRFGDGEFLFFKKRGISYQSYSEQLEYDLDLIVRTYDEKSNYILCMPRKYFQCNGIRLLKIKKLFVNWAYPRLYFKKYFDKDTVYGDAFCFSKGKSNIYEKIWNNSSLELIIFVHNNEEYYNNFCSCVNNDVNIEFIKISASEAYDNITYIINEITSKIGNEKRAQVIISGGPAAKIIAFKLSKKNIQTIDTGHCWCTPLNEK